VAVVVAVATAVVAVVVVAAVVAATAVAAVVAVVMAAVVGVAVIANRAGKLLNSQQLIVGVALRGRPTPQILNSWLLMRGGHGVPRLQRKKFLPRRLTDGKAGIYSWRACRKTLYYV
jgi:hypothetical protein